MKNSDLQKAKEAKESFAAFFEQFGELDEYKMIVLEVLFQELYGRKEKNISLPSQERQDGD